MSRRCPIPQSSDIVVVLDTINCSDALSPTRDITDNIINELIRECNVINVIGLDDIGAATGNDGELLYALEREAKELGAIVILVTELGRRYGFNSSRRRTALVYVYILPATLFGDQANYTKCLVLALVHAELVSILRHQAPVFGELYASAPAALVA